MYDELMQSLQEAIDFEKGNISLRTFECPDNASEIKDIRSSSGLTQRGFADFLGVSVRTVEAWESGVNTPSGPARRIMSFIRSDPDFIKKYS